MSDRDGNARMDGASEGEREGRSAGGRTLDGMGHDTAHGPARDEDRERQGGTTGRSTGGRAEDDLATGMNASGAPGRRGDPASGTASGDMRDATDRQREAGMRRQGLEGKGFDAGTGYGGAGNDALYSGESAYGGQSAEANSALGGAYQGERYGRDDDDDAGRPRASSGGRHGGKGQGKGDLSAGARIPPATDEQAVNDAMDAERSGGTRSARGEGGSEDDVDMDELPNGAGRRDPVR